MNEKIPETEIELEDWMKKNCYNFDSYSVNGNFIWEGYGIDKNGPLYYWYYTEHGQKNNLEIFRSEKEIIEFAFTQISSDKWAKTHCIGFTLDEHKSSKLSEILKKQKIDFIQDKIPFYADKPAFRTFVLGCDIKQSEYLKTEFYEELK
ncbi:hypothetical protein [Chryseobacterium oryctis]|uniref:Uncharacterized protein n=1 Tax=Chryseobacterium oryctis TaxID=2952618 RepID=A0ABT3HK82_9FLAO|nr:hypothetical protein [Chryseobacterium oryctis]MCW3160166.1 hypothetical protein [Chryseobacterium oryctis]